MNNNKRLETFSFFGLFAAASLLLYFVFAPFLQILALAAMFASLFHEFYEDVARAMGGWKSPAALIVVSLVFLFCIVPIFLFGWQIFLQAQSLYAVAQGNGAQYVQTAQSAIETPIRHVFPQFSFDISTLIDNILAFISSNLASIVSQAFTITLQTFLMLLAFFFFLRDGRMLITAIVAASPLGKRETREILDNMYRAIQSVIIGTLVIGFIRWVLITACFYIFHIPNTIFWSTIGGVIGVIPGLGTPFAFIPAVAYLYFASGWLSAAGLAVLGFATIMLVDNLLTAYLFGKGLPVPQVFVLFSVLGGIFFFGPLGFILGPLALSVFLSVFHIYSTLTHESETSHS